MIEPLIKDEAFLTEVAEANRLLRGDDFNLWWLGQAGFLVQWRNRHLLIDPYLSDSLTVKYADTDKPHVRMTARIVDPAKLNFIDAVSSSHNHTDHLDHETLWPLMSVNPNLQLIVPEANRAFAAERLRCSPDWFVGCDDGRTVEAGGYALTGVASAHEALEQDELGRYKHLGYLIRFGPWTIYHSGDAIPYEGLNERLRSLTAESGVDVALLPINGRASERRVPGNFFAHEAIALARAVNARLVIPMHYEMFTFNTASPEGFVADARRAQQPFKVLRCGERLRSDEIIR